MKPWVTIPLVLVLQSVVNTSDPQTLLLVRVLFACWTVFQYLLWQNVKARVEALPDDGAPIFVKEAKAASLQGLLDGLLGSTPESAASQKWKQTTYKALEAERVAQQAQQALMGPLMNVGMSFYMGIHLPMMLQCVLGPLGLYEDPTVRRHFLGYASVAGPDTPAPVAGAAPKPGVYGELAHDPSAAPAAAGTRTLTGGADGAVVPSDGPVSGAPVDDVLEDVIFSCWESSDPAPMAGLLALKEQGKPVATYATGAQGWTALMVVAGSPQNGKKEVLDLLEWGAAPPAVDVQGWNALHWAAYHGNETAAAAICSAYTSGSSGGAAAGASARGSDKTKRAPAVVAGGAAELAALLAAVTRGSGDDAHKAAAGKTPLALAEQEGNDAVAAVLRAAYAALPASVRAKAEREAAAAAAAAPVVTAAPPSPAAAPAAAAAASNADASPAVAASEPASAAAADAAVACDADAPSADADAPVEDAAAAAPAAAEPASE